jgi:tRNA threonylcarbamoyl adenosine modification protein (Sua5/YciO/YrdC/YwlC family)
VVIFSQKGAIIAHMTSGEFVSNCTADALSSAAQLLKAGGLVALPTETVYGLGADATNKDAVSRIYKVKGRPADHPLIVHIHSMQSLGEWADEIPSYAISLARDFWPGPMTLVLKRSMLAEDFVTGGQPTVGLRVPDHVVALALLSAFENIGGKGIAAPSANRSGQVSPTTARHVLDGLAGRIAAVLEGGACAVGVESTVLDLSGGGAALLVGGERGDGSTDAQTYSAGALWHLASSADSKAQMAEAGAIPPLVAVLRSPSAEARDHAAAVLSTLARGQVANKRAILKAAGLPPLIKLLTDPRVQSQQYAACALWGLAESEELNCAREMVEEHVIAPLIEMLQANHPSPLSARRGPMPFVGCSHFSLAQSWLRERGVNWRWDWALTTQEAA